MNLVKQYIIQSITTASNNLRLSNQKIEVVALLRDYIIKSEDLEEDLKNMKKVTELSTLAIRLNDIYSYLSQPHIDLFKISDKIKEHSSWLIKDISHMLDMVNPVTISQALEKINKKPEIKSDEIKNESKESPASNNSINVDLSKRKLDENTFDASAEIDKKKIENEKIKENLIFEEEKEDEDLFFQNYEASILKPIKPIDAMLKNISENKIDQNEIIKFAHIMKNNGEQSSKIGFEIISNMHKVVSKALFLINVNKLAVSKDVVEALRACLIVIVAVVRGKEVDITNYLNKAEEFGKRIQTIKIKEFS